MGVDVSVRYENLHREANGNVAGKIVMKVSGSVLGQDFDVNIENRDFNFPQGSEQKVYDQDFPAGPVKVKVTATVHERTAGQCCLLGHVHVDVGVGGGLGTDLDPNCQPIP